MKQILFLITLYFIVGCGNQTSSSKPETDDKIASEETQSESKYSIAVSGSCSYTGELTSNQVYGFTSDNEAQTALTRIMNYTGLPVNFKLMAADVDNACAVIQRKSSGDMLRYIMYNQQFMIGVKDLTKTHWSEISILAHEIGHHLSGHTLLQGGSRPDLELEADRFSGYILYKMGATLDDAQVAMKTFASDNSSSTHPAKKSRLVAITNGWLAAKEQDNSKQPENTNQTTTTPAETTNKTIETASSSVRERIVSTLNRYYQINEAVECNELANFYLPIVDNFYNKTYQSTADIVNECINYHNRWPYQQMSIDNSTFAITQLNDGDYFVTYDMFYQVKRTIQDTWKNFYLTINVRFTPDLKIRSMYEYQKPKY
ncbi:MAG: hypothetical protein HEQ40_00710 [Lacibacter sp.]